MSAGMLTKISIIAVSLILLTGTALTMGRMVSATGPYNYNCSVFVEGKSAERAKALVFAQGYAAAVNNLKVDGYGRRADFQEVNLLERWREFDKRVVRYCTDESNPYLHRKFMSDAAYEALNQMTGRKLPE